MGVVHSSPDTNFVQELAASKRVSQRNNFTMDVVCYEVGIGALQCGMW